MFLARSPTPVTAGAPMMLCKVPLGKHFMPNLTEGAWLTPGVTHLLPWASRLSRPANMEGSLEPSPFRSNSVVRENSAFPSVARNDRKPRGKNTEPSLFHMEEANLDLKTAL